MPINTIRDQQIPAYFSGESQRVRREIAAPENFRTQLTQIANPRKPEKQLVEENEIISPAEMDYFGSLFPTAADQVKTYHAYQRSGVPQAGGLGTVVDKKG